MFHYKTNQLYFYRETMSKEIVHYCEFTDRLGQSCILFFFVILLDKVLPGFLF